MANGRPSKPKTFNSNSSCLTHTFAPPLKAQLLVTWPQNSSFQTYTVSSNWTSTTNVSATRIYLVPSRFPLDPWSIHSMSDSFRPPTLITPAVLQWLSVSFCFPSFSCIIKIKMLRNKLCVLFFFNLNKYIHKNNIKLG